MARSEGVMRDVLVLAFVSFKALAENSPGPAQKRIATERAGNCLWALGIDQSHGFTAVCPEPPGDTVEAVATKPFCE